MTGLYAKVARRYLAAGWGSPLPLPPRRKKSPPDKWTGRQAPDASAADVEAWCEEHPDGNIGMRLALGIVGIDVDAHKGEQAQRAWRELVEKYGPLPPHAPRCTSRPDESSGIRLFRVPEDYVATGIMGAAGEVIQRHHRYVVVPPSVSPDPPAGTGQPYRWVNLEEGMIPRREDLPVLPTAWQEGLRAGAADSPAEGTTWTNPDVDALATRGIPDGANQDEYLRDLVFKLAAQGIERAATHAVWITVIARTKLSRPGEPWTDADFERHWHGAAVKTVHRFTQVEETRPGQAADLYEYIARTFGPEDWVIRDLLERGDRLIWTGAEGAGKSVMTRQIGIAAAAGIHPFNGYNVTPKRVLFVDAENTERKSVRKFQALEGVARFKNRPVPPDGFRIIHRPEGIDLSREDEQAWLMELVVAHRPDFVVIGPLYKLHRLDVNEEPAARAIVAVLDEVRTRADCAIMVEAHAPHGPEGSRGRPAGSSLFMRWPEFGYGMTQDADSEQYGPKTRKRMRVIPWRGPREERSWPRLMTWGGEYDWPWVPLADKEGTKDLAV